MASFLESLKKALKPDTYAAVIDEAGEEFDWSVVPYSRFSKVVGERNALRTQVADFDETAAGGDPDKKFTQADIDKAVSAKETELKASFDAERTNSKVREAALAKLREANALDSEMIYDSSKFDKSTLKLGKAGELEGIDELIKTFKAAHGSLFGEGDVEKGTGKHGGGNQGNHSDTVDAALNSMFSSTFGIGTVME